MSVDQRADAMKMKGYETAARYALGAVYLFGAVDGALFLFFGIYMHGKPPDRYLFLLTLQATTYFWAFLKLIQTIGAFSLLTNYKPALGTALLLPVSSCLILFYLFELPSFLPTFGTVIVASTIILCRAYWKSYARLFDDYPARVAAPALAESGTLIPNEHSELHP
jgi:putative oxidoreductase